MPHRLAEYREAARKLMMGRCNKFTGSLRKGLKGRNPAVAEAAGIEDHWSGTDRPIMIGTLL